MTRSKYTFGVILSGCFILIGLSSCQVVNKYKTPEIDSQNLYRDVTTEDSTTIADIPWREFFTDSYLQAYIDEALENNHDMLALIQRVKQSEAALGMARAAYFPQVSLTGQVNQTRLSAADPLTGTPKDRNSLAYHTESYQLGLVASWELDVWGKLNRQKRSKYAQMLNSYAGKNLMQTTLIANIANSYYSLLSLDEQLRVTNEMIRLMEKTLVMTEALMDAGLTNGAAVEQLKASIASTKTTIPDLETSIRQLENSFSTLLGRKPGSIERTKLENQSVPKAMNYGVPMQMLSRRPDVQQAEMEFRSAFELTNVARASFYPSITLSSAMLGYSTTNGLSQFFKPENLFASIAGGLTQPLFARKQLITQYKTAKYEEKATLISFEKAVLAAGQEVSDIIVEYENALKKDYNRTVQVNSLTKAVSYTTDLFSAGESNYLEVITAQQDLLQAQLSQVSDKLQQLQAATNLYRALGGGVE